MDERILMNCIRSFDCNDRLEGNSGSHRSWPFFEDGYNNLLTKRSVIK